MTSPTRLLAATALTGLALLIAACAPTPPESPPSTPAVTTPPADTTTTAPEPVSTDTPTKDVSCESLVSQGTVDALVGAGWTVEKRDFRIGPDVVPGGLQCFWADFTKASDHGQLYGWAPISADTARTAQDRLAAEGWIREESDRGVYVTVDPQFALSADDDGYGMTYLFGDGWVTLSDTRQGLVLIELPQ